MNNRIVFGDVDMFNDIICWGGIKIFGFRKSKAMILISNVLKSSTEAGAKRRPRCWISKRERSISEPLIWGIQNFDFYEANLSLNIETYQKHKLIQFCVRIFSFDLCVRREILILISNAITIVFFVLKRTVFSLSPGLFTSPCSRD